MEPETKDLHRYLSRLDVFSMAFGCTVGWGAFVMPGTTFLPLAGPTGTVLAMGIGMLVMLLIASNLSYLMSRNPWTGGLYAYTKEAFGRDHAFLCAWFLCLSYLTIVFLNSTALFLVLRTLFGESVQTGIQYTVAGNRIDLGEVLVSAVATVGVGVLFMVARRTLQRLLTALSVILASGAMLVTLFCVPHVEPATILGSFGTGEAGPAFSVFSLVILAPWAFVGFEMVTFDTVHFRFPLSKARTMVAFSIIMAALVYIGMTLVSVSAIPESSGNWQSYIASLDSRSGIEAVPTFHAAWTWMGGFGLVLVALAALAAILTGIIGAYRAMVRVLSAMAEDRILSSIFSRTTPSILFIMGLSILISLLGRNTLIWFVDLTAFGAVVAYGYSSAATFKIARTENDRGRMVAGALGTVIATCFAVVQLVPGLAALDAMGSEAFLLLALWCLLGFVFYWRTVIRSTLTEYSGMSMSGVVLFALLVYAALMWLGKRLFGLSSDSAMHGTLIYGGIVLLGLIFAGMGIMLYIQRLVRSRHEDAEREKIRAVEGSLAKSRFLFNMSHDIRTPMNAIIGYTGLAMTEQDPDTVRQYLGKIDISGRHLLDLINDILEMSRIESGKMEMEYTPTDLVRIFDEARDLFSGQMRAKSLDFSVHTGQIQHRYVWCDRKNLNRVLLNMISNAFKFTPAGGSVSVSVWEAGTSDEEYGQYEIRVRDTGIGMSREFADRMFTPFERERTSTDSGVEGTGLGLSITRSIVDLMGGTIEVITAPGSGTEMVIRLKMRLATEEQIEQEKEVLPAAAPVDYTKKRVLLVEDNAVNMEIAEMILGQQGFMLETAENGQLALDKVVRSPAGTYDVILMDIQMPVMDGYTATRKIRALEDPEKARIPILAMTANAFKEDEQAAMEAGMQAHIAKPIDVGQLLDALNRVLQEEDTEGKHVGIASCADEQSPAKDTGC